MNPEHDPGERRRRAPRGGNRYRDRDDGGYRSQRYDDREHRKRQHSDENAGFDVSLYDDDEAALAQRANRSHRRQDSTSGSDSRDRYNRRSRDFGDRYSKATGKELFPDRGNGSGGRLRDRSASPVRDVEGDLEADRKYEKLEADRKYERDRRNNAAAANRSKAQAIKAQIVEAGTKELFPHKVGVSHHRSLAFDAADATADLFATQMSVPLMDGSADERPRRSSSRSDAGGFNIRGTAKAAAKYDFAIKGVARTSAKELFPSRSGNTGKELFAALEGRGGRRERAEDLFY